MQTINVEEKTVFSLPINEVLSQVVKRWIQSDNAEMVLCVTLLTIESKKIYELTSIEDLYPHNFLLKPDKVVIGALQEYFESLLNDAWDASIENIDNKEVSKTRKAITAIIHILRLMRSYV